MVAWAMEYLGRDDVHVMDVVFDQWKAQGREVFYRPVPPEARRFTPRANPSVRASLAEVSGASGASGFKLVDTRSQEEYRGETETDERPGHIPGAVNIVWQGLVGQDGQLTCSQEKARRVLDEAGISQNEPIVAYCQVGARAAVAYLAFQPWCKAVAHDEFFNSWPFTPALFGSPARDWLADVSDLKLLLP